MKKLLILLIVLFSAFSTSYAVEYNDEFNIRYIRINSERAFFYMSLNEGSPALQGCGCDSGGCYVGLEMTDAASKEIYSLALSAMHSGKRIRVLGNTDNKLPNTSMCKMREALVMQ